MKNRKPSKFEQEQFAKELLRNELINQKSFLKVAEKKINELIEKIKSGDNSKKIQKELAEQEEIARNIIAWIQKNEKTA